MTTDTRQFAAATQRNREAILEVLFQVLPPTGTVLEVSSGTGEHAVFFAPRLAPRPWIPTDRDPVAIASITAWRDHSPVDNLYPPLRLDAIAPQWPVEQRPLPDSLQGLDLSQHPITAIVNINMIHIAPWEACLGLMAGAERILPPGGILYLYGPYQEQGGHTAPSNEAFDAMLQSQNPAWGVRHLEAVVEAAQNHHLEWVTTCTMPANNRSVVFRRLPE